MKQWFWLCLLCLLPRTSSAQVAAPQGPALNWLRLPGAESCITAAELAARVEERLQRSVFVLAQGSELSFDGYVQARAAGGFSARLAVSNASGAVLGSRELESPDASCRALDDALVLITALTLFPGDFGLQGGIPLDAETNERLQALFGDEPSELDPATLPPPATALAAIEPQASGAPQEAAPQREPSSDPARARIAIEAAPVAAFGVLPGIALGVSAELTVRLNDLWPLRAGIAHFFERDQRATQLATGTGHFERSELSLFACPYAPDEPWALELCVGTAFGLLSVRSDGFADGGIEASDPVLDVGGSAGLRVLFADTLVARASVTALLPLVQQSYEYQALDASTAQLFRTAQAGVRMQIGIGAQF
jgi:hypothetical protein